MRAPEATRTTSPRTRGHTNRRGHFYLVKQGRTVGTDPTAANRAGLGGGIVVLAGLTMGGEDGGHLGVGAGRVCQQAAGFENWQRLRREAARPR